MLNSDILHVLWLELNSQFQNAYGLGEDATVDQFVTSMPLSTLTMRFDFLKGDPEFRKWSGQRTFHQLDNSKYEVSYDDYENGLRVLRRDIINNIVGPYSIQSFSLGQQAKYLKPKLCAAALDAGSASTSLCFDGQPFFDVSHPVGEGDDVTLVSNYIGSGGASAASPWYMMDLSRPIKPIIHLEREPVRFYSFTDLKDQNVFNNREFLFAADASQGTGYGLWHSCFRIEDTATVQKILDTDFAMRDLRGDKKDEHGRRPKLGIKPTHIVYGATNRVRMFQLQQATIASTWTTDPNTSPGATDTQKPNPIAGKYTFQEVTWLP